MNDAALTRALAADRLQSLYACNRAHAVIYISYLSQVPAIIDVHTHRIDACREPDDGHVAHTGLII